jgi:SLT domain-containing protein
MIDIDGTTDRSQGTQDNDRGGWQGGLRAAGKSLQKLGDRQLEDASNRRITPVAYKRGGKVRKTGIAMLHKAERVIPRGKAKRVEKMMRKAKMRMKARN